MAHLVRLHQGSCGDWQPRQRPDAVITNPPWGNRLMGAKVEDSSALEATWTELGLFVKVSASLQQSRRTGTPPQGCWQHLLNCDVLEQATLLHSCCDCVEAAEVSQRAAADVIRLCRHANFTVGASGLSVCETEGLMGTAADLCRHTAVRLRSSYSRATRAPPSGSA